jgi:formate dehydrogenase subunit gamma
VSGAAVAPVAARGRRSAALVRRFSGAERALHWLFTLDVTLLTLSGLGLYLPPDRNPVLDRRELVRTVHIDSAIALVLLPIVLSAVRPGTLARLWRDVERFDADDWRWLRRIWLPAPLRRRLLPSQGRFNAGQKLNTIAIAAATVGFIGTGVLMDVGAHLPPSLSDAADTWHIWLMLLCAPLVAGHLVLALLVPSTRPALRGIVTGWVRLDFARRRHAKWTADVAPAEAVPADPDRQVVRVTNGTRTGRRHVD